MRVISSSDSYPQRSGFENQCYDVLVEGFKNLKRLLGNDYNFLESGQFLSLSYELLLLTIFLPDNRMPHPQNIGPLAALTKNGI